VRRGRHAEALACFDAALERLGPPWDAAGYEAIAVHRARTLARLGRREEAAGAWHALALEGGRAAGLAWLQVAKHREHDAGDVEAALDAARRARALADRRRLFGLRDRLVERDLARRVPRLQRRLASLPVQPP
jgi:tetratricopeptide (TPR) repeat protein